MSTTALEILMARQDALQASLASHNEHIAMCKREIAHFLQHVQLMEAELADVQGAILKIN